MRLIPASHGRRDAQERDEPADEDGLRAVSLEEALGRRQHPLRVPPRDRPAVDQRPAAVAPEPVADVVADDRGEAATTITQNSDEVTLLGPREERGGDQRRLAGDRHARGLDAIGDEQDHEPVVLEQAWSRRRSVGGARSGSAIR